MRNLGPVPFKLAGFRDRGMTSLPLRSMRLHGKISSAGSSAPSTHTRIRMWCRDGSLAVDPLRLGVLPVAHGGLGRIMRHAQQLCALSSGCRAPRPPSCLSQLG
jgi:hypothetical protein